MWGTGLRGGCSLTGVMQVQATVGLHRQGEHFDGVGG